MNMTSAKLGSVPQKRKKELILQALNLVHENLIILQNESWFSKYISVSEDIITQELCCKMAVLSKNESFFFHHQIREENGRSIDFSILIYDNYENVQKNTILHFETKRLPAPTNNRKREYLMGEIKKNDKKKDKNEGIKSGGVQRFKEEIHGKYHTEAVILGYIQKYSIPYFSETVNAWIDDLSANPIFNLKWDTTEYLRMIDHNKEKGVAKLQSCHPRIDKPPILLHHLWIEFLITATD